MNIFGKNILVVAAHPDDEMLGCGATLAKLVRAGATVTMLLLGEGPMSRGADGTQRERAVASARAAAKQLGISDVRFGSLPDNSFDTVSLLSIIRLVEEVADEVLPDTVFTHHAGDLNVDHQRTHQAVMTAFRPLPTQKPVLLLGFEVLSSTDYTPAGTLTPFMPQVYVDVAETLAAKQLALAEYGEEMRPWPYSRSHQAVEHLARLRGANVGMEAAEAFVLYRHVIKS